MPNREAGKLANPYGATGQSLEAFQAESRKDARTTCHPQGTRIQIEVSSIDEAIYKEKEYGALIVREEMEFDDFFLAYLVDPTGLGLGLIQKK